MVKCYKYRIKDRYTSKKLVKHAYAVNQIWNWCCGYQKNIQNKYNAGAPKQKWPSHFDLTKLCKGAGGELGINQQTVGEVCRSFSEARNKNKSVPRFRSSFGSNRRCGWVPFQRQSRQIEENSVWYRGVRYRFFGSKKRPVPSNAKGGCFVEDSLGRWWVCFFVEVQKLGCSGFAVGIDLGLKDFATLSDGVKIESPRFYRNSEHVIALASRSNNKNKLRRIHTKIKNRRSDFLHKLSTELAARYSLIAVGNVSSSKLAKTRMAKSVFDAGWSAFRSMLQYKATSYMEVDEKFTTQTCSRCGVIPDSSPKGMGALGIRQWECSSCGASHDRDVNAARNILNVALSAQRLAEESQSFG